MAPWRLFLDDDADTVRQPSETVENGAWRANRGLSVVRPETSHLGEWKIARSVDEAITLLDQFGLPAFVSFDHDLCDEAPGRNGLMVAVEITSRDMRDGSLSADFGFEVHSWNPTGAQHIIDHMTDYLSKKSLGLVSIADPINELTREEAYAHLFGSN